MKHLYDCKGPFIPDTDTQTQNTHTPLFILFISWVLKKTGKKLLYGKREWESEQSKRSRGWKRRKNKEKKEWKKVKMTGKIDLRARRKPWKGEQERESE